MLYVIKETIVTILIKLQQELIHDWGIFKHTTMFVLFADFAGVFKGLIGTYNFDTGVITACVVMMFSDVGAGMYRALKNAEFDGKKLGYGIFKKIIKYGVLIMVLIQLMNMTYKGNPVEALQSMAFLFYVGIIGIELDSICGNLFGVKLSSVLNQGVKTIGIAKKVADKLRELKDETQSEPKV